MPLLFLALIANLSPQESLAPILVDSHGRAITSRRGWERQRKLLREQWLRFLGPLPAKRAPLNLEILEVEELPDFTRKHIRYQVESGVTTDGYLLLPKSQWDKRPGVVVFHQTVATQAKQPAGVDPSNPELMIGVQLVQRGFVVLCPRCFIFDDGSDYKGNVEKMQRAHPDWTGMARMTFDGIRAADLLSSLPEVDPKRIGCIGHSLGAKEALYAATFDPRYQVAVFSEGGIGTSMSNWDAIWYLGPRIKETGFPLEHHQLLALIAPRAFLLLAGDSADSDNSSAFIEAARPVYNMFGADNRLRFLNHKHGHRYPPDAREAAEAFLSEL